MREAGRRERRGHRGHGCERRGGRFNVLGAGSHLGEQQVVPVRGSGSASGQHVRCSLWAGPGAPHMGTPTSVPSAHQVRAQRTRHSARSPPGKARQPFRKTRCRGNAAARWPVGGSCPLSASSVVNAEGVSVPARSCGTLDTCSLGHLCFPGLDLDRSPTGTLLPASPGCWLSDPSIDPGWRAWRAKGRGQG